MRIVFIGPTPPLLGGIAAHSRGAVDALRARGHEVHSLGYTRLYPRWLAGARPGSLAPSARRGPALDVLAMRSWSESARAIRSLAPDVVVAQYWNPLVGVALAAVLHALGSVRCLAVVHNLRPHESVPGAGRIARTILQRADALVFHSGAVEREALRLASPALSAVVNMPLLVGGWGERPAPPPEVSDLAVPASPRRLLVCAGHLRAYKGLDVLAAAWRRLGPSASETLVVAGEPFGSARGLRALRRLAGSVRLIERYLSDEELVWLLGSATAVVLPHVAGSQSGLLGSALRLAPAVVATAVCLGADPCRVAGAERLRIVAPGDTEGLAAAIGAALSASTPAAGGASTPAAPRHTPGRHERRASWQPFVHAVEQLGATTAASKSRFE